MESILTDVAALLRGAKGLMGQDQPDIEAMLDLLDTLPLYDFDMPTRLAMAHARRVTTASLDGNALHATIARCALARVVALLERHVVVSSVSNRVA